MNELIVMVGNVGSGKSTWSKKNAVTMSNPNGYLVVSRDAIRYMLGGGNYLFFREVEPLVHRITITSIEDLLKQGQSVIVDETNVSKKMRKQYIQLARKYKCCVTAVVMKETTMKEAVKRKMKVPHGQKNKKLWEGVFRRFKLRYQKPTLQEGFDVVMELD